MQYIVYCIFTIYVSILKSQRIVAEKNPFKLPIISQIHVSIETEGETSILQHNRKERRKWVVSDIK